MLTMATKEGNDPLSELKTERLKAGVLRTEDAVAAPKVETADAKASSDDIDDDDVALTFPQRLMEILDNEENADIISWLHHGRGFVIFRKKAFEQKILPKYFNKQSKYSSFTRKLNRWGFCRVTRGPEAGAYYHQYFQRGGHRLVMQMSCQSCTKGASDDCNKKMSPPNFSNLAAGTSVQSAAGAAALSPVLPSTFSLHSAAAEQAALQQQQQLLQLHIQQELFQQEATRRAILASQSRLSSLQQSMAIPPVSLHQQQSQQQQQQQQQDSFYSQLLTAQLAQAERQAAANNSSLFRSAATTSGMGGIGIGGGDPGQILSATSGFNNNNSSATNNNNNTLGVNFLNWKNNFPSM